MKPLLSIVIPSHNSEEVISPNLESLLPQVIKHDEVELIVINNGSTDNTRVVLNSFLTRFPDSFSYLEREEVITPELNFFDGVERAQGEYVFLLGDDDVLSLDFLDIILPFLDGVIGLIHFNRLECRNCFTRNSLLHQSNKITNTYTLYQDGREFIEEYDYEFNFMSSVLFRKSVWENGRRFVTLDKPYYGYYWYANLLFGIEHTPCVYYHFPIVLQRIREHSWARDWALYGIVGMFSIYRDLDDKLPGLYNVFYSRHHDERRGEFLRILGSIIPYADYYREKKDLFYPFLNKRERILFLIYTSKLRFLAKAVNYLVLHISSI